jgi:hypothetical protein
MGERCANGRSAGSAGRRWLLGRLQPVVIPPPVKPLVRILPPTFVCFILRIVVKQEFIAIRIEWAPAWVLHIGVGRAIIWMAAREIRVFSGQPLLLIFVEADLICSSGPHRVPELRGIILPIAELAAAIAAGWLVEREIPADRTGISKLWHSSIAQSKGHAPGSQRRRVVRIVIDQGRRVELRHPSREWRL